jgi:MFS family permease
MLTGAAVFYPGQAGSGLVLLLAVHRATGSFACAGAAGAASTVGFSLSSIIQGRLLDRRGTPVLLPPALACRLATAATAGALAAGAGAALLIILAGVFGASFPSAGTSLRTVWSTLLDDADQRATAFAYQSLAQDAGFAIGPSALGALATTVAPELALGCCGALIATGAVLIATVPSPVAVVRPGSDAARRPFLRPLAPLAASLAAVGVALGTIDVSITAFASEHHGQQFAGILLAAFSVGSIAGGVAYGARHWRSGLHVRLLGCTLALAVVALGAVGPLLGAAILLLGILHPPPMTTVSGAGGR